MAERRMFAKTIIDSDAFLDMPLSSQALYFHLSMRADDDGFINNPKKIQRMVGASEDDLKVLLAKKFIIAFESGVVVVKHWRIHNYIQNDRYKPTVYREEKALLTVKNNNAYSLDTECIHDVSKVETQVRLGKDRLEFGKDRLERENARAPEPVKKTYGIFNNVRMTDEEMAELIKALPDSYQDYIERLSLHKESKGALYNSDYATIRKWFREDKEKEKKNRKEDCINDRSKYGDDEGLFESFKTALDNAPSE